ncbi:MAG: hypothetical protein LBU76_09065 [Azoarcus sp.]|jgi:KDO transferase-3|nr:hypothetical protein [Azoarcus sp.]
MLELSYRNGKYYMHEDDINLPLSEFEKYNNIYSGSVFLLASGASVNDFPVSRYSKFPFVAMNGSILRLVDENVSPLFYVCDDSRFPHEHPELAVSGCKNSWNIAMTFKSYNEIWLNDPTVLFGKPLYFLDRINRHCIGKNVSDRRFAWSVRNDLEIISSFSLFGKKINRIGFSKNMARGFYNSRTVVYTALQLVYTLGFQKVFIVGMDMNKAVGRFYDNKSGNFPQKILPTTIDVDYDNYILPSFKIFSEKFLKKQDSFKVFNLSKSSRIPDKVIPKISINQLDSLLFEV